MEATLNNDAPSSGGDAVTARLRVDVYDRLALAKGIRSVVAGAALHGIHRATLFDYRSGKKSPHLPTAMQMAADLETTVEELFELQSGGGRD